MLVEVLYLLVCVDLVVGFVRVESFFLFLSMFGWVVGFLFFLFL